MTKVEIFAPVLICTLNRHVHFKRCVESLSTCIHANETDLYICLDYPSDESHWNGYNITKDYLPQIRGFKSVNITIRKTNFGVNENWSDMISHVFEKYDRLIISEDDNLFAKSFLEFVNNGLNTYQHRNEIFSICGYLYPFKMLDRHALNAYMLPAFSAWGVGIWREKWNKVDFKLSSFNQMLSIKNNYRQLKKNYGPWFYHILQISKTEDIKGDGYITLYLIHNKMYSIFPVNTKVVNIGYDGSGVNCGYNEIYSKQKVIEIPGDTNLSEDIHPDKEVLEVFYSNLRLTYIESVKASIPTNIKNAIKFKLNKYLKTKYILE
jgi:hypothetical protein